jgi:multisubunit Na+/H+ antiporter MnhG subunit
MRQDPAAPSSTKFTTTSISLLVLGILQFLLALGMGSVHFVLHALALLVMAGVSMLETLESRR